MTALAVRAREAGIELRDVGDRVEAWLGKKIIAFHSTSERAMSKALERIEADRIAKLPYGEEPDLTKPRGRALVPVAAPRPPPPVRAVSRLPRGSDLVPDYAPEVVAAAVARVIKGSIVKDKYKNKYKANGGSCGDLVAEELGEFVRLAVNGQMRTSVARLTQVAKDNDLWLERYSGLNVGQLRMTVGNRLRIKYAEGAEIIIGGAPFCMKIEV